jgi:hypothetical protein
MVISWGQGSDGGPQCPMAAWLRTSRVLKSPARVASLVTAVVLAVMAQRAVTSSAGRPDHDHPYPADGKGNLR